MQLWVDKYKPKKLEDIAGQNKPVSEVLGCIQNWKQGKGLLITGQSGSGKSCLVEALCSEKKWLLTRLDANEHRNKEAIESFVSSSKNHSLFSSGKSILIDELEGRSGGERGAASGIVSLIKESRFPVFLISEDPYISKFSDIRKYCDMIKLPGVAVPSIVKRLREIAKSEGIKTEDDVLKTLARFSQGDLRSAINDLQTACVGKKELKAEDLAPLGFREKENSVFNSLSSIFRSKNLKSSANILSQTDKDPDEIFWWIESNIFFEAKTNKEIIDSYNLLSLSNMYRQLVFRQQNWRFKKISMDLMSGISLQARSGSGFAMYRPPQRFLQLARTKGKRALSQSVSEKIGKKVHCSKKILSREYFPYMKTYLKKYPKLSEQLGLEEEEIEIFP